MISKELPLDSLLLDPNNYRLQDEEGFRATASDRAHLEQVQKGTFNRLKGTGLRELRDSIVSNGFLPIERIVVTPYTEGDAEDKYLVIEGNRRVASLKMIQDEAQGGVPIPATVVDVLSSVPCIVVEDEGQDAFFRETLMGIRHVGGIKQWGGYQRAKLIADLRDKHGLEGSDVAAKLGLSPREVNRRYRAFKALQQMRDNDDFGDFSEPSLYPIFHEAVERGEVREWLGWDAEDAKFKNEEALLQFYGLITPRQAEENGNELPPKIKAYGDVRQLKSILPNPDAKRYLLDADRTFLDALTVANRDDLSRKWRSELTEAVASLSNIGALEVANFSPADISLLDKLMDAATQIKQIHQAVRGE